MPQVYTLPFDVTTAENEPPHATWRASSPSSPMMTTRAVLLRFWPARHGSEGQPRIVTPVHKAVGEACDVWKLGGQKETGFAPGSFTPSCPQ